MKSPKVILDRFRAKFPPMESRRAGILLVIQLALLLLLCATDVLVCVVRAGTFALYFPLVTGLVLVIGIALKLNTSGRYKPSAWLTVAATVLGPWGAVLLDDTIASGDFVPLIYIALSIQLCALLLTERATLIIAGLQFFSLVLFLSLSTGLMQLNWPSLLAFVVFVATLGIVSSLTNRRQIEQIERQRNKMLQDEERLQELSARDSLTGLYNRRYMDEALRREIDHALRTGSRLGLVMIDVDEFKYVNDTFGHALGDLVLCDIAARLRENIRRTDIACRFGGDEFVLILPDCSLSDCIARAQAICAAVGNNEFVCQGVYIGNVGLSIGAAALPEDGWTAEEIMKAADGAMYSAKSEGKNRVRSASAIGRFDVGLGEQTGKTTSV